MIWSAFVSLFRWLCHNEPGRGPIPSGGVTPRYPAEPAWLGCVPDGAQHAQDSIGNDRLRPTGQMAKCVDGVRSIQSGRPGCLVSRPSSLHVATKPSAEHSLTCQAMLRSSFQGHLWKPIFQHQMEASFDIVSVSAVHLWRRRLRATGPSCPTGADQASGSLWGLCMGP